MKHAILQEGGGLPGSQKKLKNAVFEDGEDVFKTALEWITWDRVS